MLLPTNEEILKRTDEWVKREKWLKEIESIGRSLHFIYLGQLLVAAKKFKCQQASKGLSTPQEDDQRNVNEKKILDIFNSLDIDGKEYLVSVAEGIEFGYKTAQPQK